MLRTRVIPVLLLRNESLVKTKQFGRFTYVGDPCNTVRIFNELEVDELIFLDTSATSERRSPNLRLLRDIADECFMPLAYGGGVTELEHAQSVLEIGFEKISINSHSFRSPQLIPRIANIFGAQAVIASIDVKQNLRGQMKTWASGGHVNTGWDPVLWAKEVESLGAGEILLTSIDREGTWSGFDLELIQKVSESVTIPVVAHGGAGNCEHIRDAVSHGASAVALGSMVVFQKKGMGVLVNFPSEKELDIGVSDGG